MKTAFATFLATLTFGLMSQAADPSLNYNCIYQNQTKTGVLLQKQINLPSDRIPQGQTAFAVPGNARKVSIVTFFSQEASGKTLLNIKVDRTARDADYIDHTSLIISLDGTTGFIKAAESLPNDGFALDISRGEVICQKR